MHARSIFRGDVMNTIGRLEQATWRAALAAVPRLNPAMTDRFAIGASPHRPMSQSVNVKASKLDYFLGASSLTFAGPTFPTSAHTLTLKRNSATAHVGMSMISLDSRCARSVNSGLWPKSITRST